jgi:NAD(P)-dependent dehydrogenase (short-subunit alcohol dehydrogenase family)
MDVGDSKSVAAGIEAAITQLGRIDGLVNCAAVAPHFGPLDTDRSEWRRIFDVNLFGAYQAASLVAKHLIGRRSPGAIVNVSSEAGKKGHSESLLAFSASMAGLISLTRMLSEALATHDINVNCVCPGSVATPMLREVAAHFSKMTGQPADDLFNSMISSQLRRHVDPFEVASVVSFLLGDDVIALRGQAINLDGGDTPY